MKLAETIHKNFGTKVPTSIAHWDDVRGDRLPSLLVINFGNDRLCFFHVRNVDPSRTLCEVNMYIGNDVHTIAVKGEEEKSVFFQAMELLEQMAMKVIQNGETTGQQ